MTVGEFRESWNSTIPEGPQLPPSRATAPDPAKAKAEQVLQEKVEEIKRGSTRRAADIAMASATVGGLGALLTAPVAFPVATATNWGDGTENIIPDVLREGALASLIGGGTVVGGTAAAALLRHMRQGRRS